MAIGGCGAADAAYAPSVRPGCPLQPRGAGGYAAHAAGGPLAPAMAGDGQTLDPIEAGYALLAEDVLEVSTIF
jgi:hypothetical protein